MKKQQTITQIFLESCWKFSLDGRGTFHLCHEDIGIIAYYPDLHCIDVCSDVMNAVREINGAFDSGKTGLINAFSQIFGISKLAVSWMYNTGDSIKLYGY